MNITIADRLSRRGEPEYYELAFNTYYTALWQKTAYNTPNDYSELSFYRMLVAFYNNNRVSINDRRELLYYYLASGDEYNITDQYSLLNQSRRKLPTQSIIPNILNNLCSAYNTMPTRKFGKEGSKEEKFFTKLYEKAKINSNFQGIYKRAKLCSVVAVTLVITNDVPRLVYITPDNFRVKENALNPNIIDEFIYADWDDTNQNVVFRKYTPTTIEIYDYDGKLIDNPANPNNINPYGIIPFVFLKLHDENTFLGGGLFTDVERCLELNHISFISKADCSYNGQPMWLSINLPPDQVNRRSPNKVIQANGVKNIEGADIPPEMIPLGSIGNFQQIDDFKEGRLKATYRDAGLPFSLIEQQSAQLTGISRIIERVPLTEQRYSDIIKLTDFEKELCNLIRVIANVDMRANLSEVEFSIAFEDERIYLEPEVEYEFDKTKVSDGIMDIDIFIKKWSGIDSDVIDVSTVIADNKAKLLEYGFVNKPQNNVQSTQEQQQPDTGLQPQANNNYQQPSEQVSA